MINKFLGPNLDLGEDPAESLAYGCDVVTGEIVHCNCPCNHKLKDMKGKKKLTVVAKTTRLVMITGHPQANFCSPTPPHLPIPLLAGVDVLCVCQPIEVSTTIS